MAADAGSANTRPGASGPARAGSLTDAVQSALCGAGTPSLTAGVQRLMTAYRSAEAPAAPIMASRNDVAAYAAYRMPATVAATAAALRQMALSVPDWRPATLLDFGAGTGSTAWAAVDELPSIGAVTLLEQSAEAIRLGKAIFARSTAPVLRTARWCQWRLQAGDKPVDEPPHDADLRRQGRALPASEPLPAADIATAAYVLGELTERQRAALVTLVAAAAAAVLFVEPGTPAGHRRILAARAALLGAGYRVVAPCPHQFACPLAVEGDWCHFGARLQRSAVHRRIKGAELSYEDEKFSYLAAVRPEMAMADLPTARIVRRPQQRKGLVALDLCADDGSSRRELVGKSKGDIYRLARKAAWGERWRAAGSGPG